VDSAATAVAVAEAVVDSAVAVVPGEELVEALAVVLAAEAGAAPVVVLGEVRGAELRSLSSPTGTPVSSSPVAARRISSSPRT